MCNITKKTEKTLSNNQKAVASATVSVTAFSCLSINVQPLPAVRELMFDEMKYKK